MDIQVYSCLDKILSQTTRLSFPRFVDEEHKLEIILKEKDEIDSSVNNLLQEHNLACISDKKKIELWKESSVEAREEFASLPPKLQLNSFYFQEIMHNYVAKIMSYLKQNCEKE